MKFESIKLFKIFLLFVGIILIFSCKSYRNKEGIYQADADIVRIQHFDYYAQLLAEYNEKTGKYPFQYEKEYPVYVFLLTNFQEKDFKDTNPYKHFTVNDKYFFQELTDILGKNIYEKYDPQKVSSDGRPNMYIYMVYEDNFYFAIHLYNSNPFTKNIDKYYNKMELSNEDDFGNKYFSYETLKNDPQYLELINRTANKQDYFNDLDEQYKNDSKN